MDKNIIYPEFTLEENLSLSSISIFQKDTSPEIKVLISTLPNFCGIPFKIFLP